MKTYWATAVATIMTGLAAQVADSAPVSIGRASTPSVTCTTTGSGSGSTSLRTGSYNPTSTPQAYPVQVTQSVPGSTPGSTVQVQIQRCYILYIPNNATVMKGPRPLVILLHGGNDNYVGAIQPPGKLVSSPLFAFETGTASSVWITAADPQTVTSSSQGQSLADKYGIIVAVPNGINDADTVNGAPDSTYLTQHWNDCSGINPGYDVKPTWSKINLARVTTSDGKTSSSNQLQLWDTANGSHYFQQTGAYSYVDDVQFIKQVIIDAKAKVNAAGGAGKTYSVDSNSVYAVGASDGGNMALRLARDDSADFAAVAGSLVGDAATSTVRSASSVNGLSTTSTYGGSADVRGPNDPPACKSTGTAVPVFILKGAPGPANSSDTYDNYKLTGDNFIPFNGGCGDGTVNYKNNDMPYSYGCWLPFDATDPNNPVSRNWLGVSSPTTLGNWLVRNSLSGLPMPAASPIVYNGIIDSRKDDGSVWPASDSDSVGYCYDWAPGTGNELQYCRISRNGHIDPSIATTAGSYEAGIIPGGSSPSMPGFGNENQDFETAAIEWAFLSKHHLSSSGVHQ